MAIIYSQDYDSETTGAEPSGFNKFVGTRLSYEVSETVSLSGAKSLKLTSVTLDHDGYWVDSGAKAGDFVVSTVMRCNDVAGNRFGLIVRGWDDSGTDKGYAFMLRSGNSARLIELRGGAETVLNTTTISSISDDTWYHLEVTIKGYTIECRYWADGGSRPSTATITVTNNTAFDNAHIGVGHYGFLDSADIIYADDLLVETIEGHEAVIVSASSDDGRNLNGATQKNITVTTQYLGQFTTTNDYWNGWRWDNVEVPQGAVISSATLDLYSAGVTAGSSVSIILYGVDEDDTVTFNNTTEYPEGKTRTSASVTKTLTVADWSSSGFNKDTIDVTTLIQEIIDRVGWSSGNALAIVAHDNGSSSSNYIGNSSYDSNADRGAKLTIEYETTVSKDETDTGSGSDAIAIVVDVGQSETGSGLDDIAIEATIDESDSSSGDDQVEVSVSVDETDTGSGTDEEDVLGIVDETETGTGIDSEDVNVTLDESDNSNSDDSLDISVTVDETDIGSGSDDVSGGIQVGIDDNAKGAEGSALVDETMVSSPSSGTLKNDATHVSGYLQLTDAVNNSSGQIEFSGAINHFYAEFDIWSGGGTGADGIYFYFNSTSTVTSEENVREGISVFASEYKDRISITYYDGIDSNNEIASPYSISTLDNSTWRKLGILCNEYEKNIKVFLDGVLVLDHTFTTFPPYLGTLYGVGARTGGLNNEHRIRNLKVISNGVDITNFLELADDGNALETLAISAVLSAADDGSGDDTLEISNFLDISDNGLGTDDLAILANLALDDSGNGNDDLSLVASVDISDVGVGDDVVAITAYLYVSDDGSAAEVITIVQTTTDTSAIKTVLGQDKGKIVLRNNKGVTFLKQKDNITNLR